MWKKLKRGAEFTADDGKSVTVLSPGTWNFEEGPDFSNAKFAIDGAEQIGDVEIHVRTSDWEKHGHSADPRYGNVKLHAVLENDILNDPFPFGIRTLDMKSLPKTRRPFSEQKKFGRGACTKFFSGLDDFAIHAFLAEAGLERLREKSADAGAEIKKVGLNDAFMRRFFESAGYKKNKDNFVELFERVREHGKLDELPVIEAVIWGESGLLPDTTTHKVAPQMKKFAADLWSEWWKNRISDRKPIKWIKNGVRPLNSPERRIAGLCAILRSGKGAPLNEILRISQINITPEKFGSGLLSLFEASDPLWDGWTNFRDARNFKASVVGKMRALDIVLNVVIPFLHAKFANSGDAGFLTFCEKTFLAMPCPQGNIKIKKAANKWFEPPSRAKSIITDAASAQGVLLIMKKFCEKGAEDCPECAMLKAIQNCEFRKPLT